MRFPALCLLLLFPAVPLAADEEPFFYEGRMRIPVALATADGNRLPAARYRLEVKGEAPARRLIFSLNGTVKAMVREAAGQDPALDSAEVPLVGTHLLRSTAVKLAPAKERQFSQTGMARYQEEKHLWDGTMRVYLSPKDGAVYFIFQERRKKRHWSRSNFRLQRTPSP